MKVYLASPRNQMQAAAVADMCVLVSFNAYSAWQDDYLPTFSRLLLDSGAYSEFNSGVRVDLGAYVEWAARYHYADAWAGLDDISGDWKRSLKNYELGGFPTIHDTDPPELLDELVAMARERGGWIGVGMKPPRTKKRWLVETLARIPADLHVHGWALRAYTHQPRLDSVDSTNWFRDALLLRRDLPWLTTAETTELIVKRYKRWNRMISNDDSTQLSITDL